MTIASRMKIDAFRLYITTLFSRVKPAPLTCVAESTEDWRNAKEAERIGGSIPRAETLRSFKRLSTPLPPPHPTLSQSPGSPSPRTSLLPSLFLHFCLSWSVFISTLPLFVCRAYKLVIILKSGVRQVISRNIYKTVESESWSLCSEKDV